MARRDDDFIVDDEGFGYKDRGGEIWETDNNADAAKKSKKQRKLNVSDSGELIKQSKVALSQLQIDLTTFFVSICAEG